MKTLKVIGLVLAYLILDVLILFLLGYLATSGEYSVPETAETDASIPTLRIGNAVFHAETFGNDTNEAVIVIHGGPGNDYRYLLPLEPLSEDYFLVFYDQRGTGLSPRVDASQQSLDTCLEDLANIIDYYAPGKQVSLIGHSWGGMLASGYIARHPDRVRKAVLAEPGFLTTEKAGEYYEMFKIKPGWKGFKAILRIVFESLHIRNPDKQARGDYIFGKLTMLDIKGNPLLGYFCDEKIGNAYFPFWRLSLTASQSIAQGGKDENGNMHIDLVSGLENHRDKVLFIVGECDQLIGQDYQKGQMKYFPDAEMAVIRNAGHTMLGEQPGESIRVIREYFQE